MALWKYRIRERRSLAGAGHPVVKLLLDARGYTDENDRERFFAPHYGRDLHDPFLFSQMDQAINRIGAALKEGETVGIFGDYDADGVTSSVVMREALEALGWRGIRITLDHPEIFMVQMRAMLKADIGLNNLQILLPMISSVFEIEEAQHLLHRAVSEVQEEEKTTIHPPKLGIMVEVPSALIQIKDLTPSSKITQQKIVQHPKKWNKK